MIRVRPSQPNRKAFAGWASRNGVRTVSSVDFGVPERLFPAIPGRLLDGALVDGQRLPPGPRRKAVRRRPEKRATKPAPPPPEPVAETEPPFEPEPEEPEAPPIAVAGEDQQPEAEPERLHVDSEEESPGHECDDPACLDCGGPQPAARHECPLCGRSFGTAHGLVIHQRRSHRDEESS